MRFPLRYICTVFEPTSGKMCRTLKYSGQSQFSRKLSPKTKSTSTFFRYMFTRRVIFDFSSWNVSREEKKQKLKTWRNNILNIHEIKISAIEKLQSWNKTEKFLNNSFCFFSPICLFKIYFLNFMRIYDMMTRGKLLLSHFS